MNRSSAALTVRSILVFVAVIASASTLAQGNLVKGQSGLRLGKSIVQNPTFARTSKFNLGVSGNAKSFTGFSRGHTLNRLNVALQKTSPTTLHGRAGAGKSLKGIAGTGYVKGIAGTGKTKGIAGTGEAKGIAGTGKIKGIAGTGKVKGIAGTGKIKGIAGTGKIKGIAGTGKSLGMANTGRTLGIAGTGLTKGIAGTGNPLGIAGTGRTIGASGKSAFSRNAFQARGILQRGIAGTGRPSVK